MSDENYEKFMYNPINRYFHINVNSPFLQDVIAPPNETDDCISELNLYKFMKKC